MTEPKTKPLTFEDLRKMAVYQFQKPMTKPPTRPWVEKMMNRLGWYRQTEVLVLKDDQLCGGYPFSQSMDPLPIKGFD